MRHVIIGAGIAGVTAAVTIKKYDKDAEVVLIGDERFFPYKRYLLTEFLNNNVKDESIFYTSEEFFAEKGIRLRKGEPVKAVSSERKAIKFHHNEVMPYDKLLIATGGRPSLGPLLQSFRQHIQSYYSLEDALLVKKRLQTAEVCIVYGRGLSTLDLIRGLRNLGKRVFYITGGPRVEFPLITSEFDKDVHDFMLEQGIEIIVNDRIVGIETKEAKYHVYTMNKMELVGDIVFAWENYAPNLACLRGCGIEKKSGILVDQQLQTSIEDIYAAGDCVEVYHPGLKDYWVNFGWPNAAQQGEVAGKNMVGLSEVYKIKETIPFNLFGKPLKARWWE